MFEDVIDGIMDRLERQEVLAALGFRCFLAWHLGAFGGIWVGHRQYIIHDIHSDSDL